MATSNGSSNPDRKSEEKSSSEQSSQSEENKGNLQSNQQSQQQSRQSYEKGSDPPNQQFPQQSHQEQPHSRQSYAKGPDPPNQQFPQQPYQEQPHSRKSYAKGPDLPNQQFPQQQQSHSRQSYAKGSDPPIYVLPYPPLYQPYPQSYQGYWQQQSGQNAQQQSGENDKQQSGQNIQQQSGQNDKQQSRQNIQQQSEQRNQQQNASSGQPNMNNSAQHRQQPYHGPQQWHAASPPPPDALYVHQYPGQPPSTRGSPMIRKGPWRDGQRDESELEGWEGFQDSNVRRTFVRKVYTILMLQLLFTLAIIALFVFEPNVKNFVRENRYLYYVSFAIFAGVYIGMACYESLRRNFPTNIIVLIVFTLATSYMLGTISSMFDTEAVFMAVGICAAVCLAVTIFAFYTKFDFTKCGGILCILLLILILFGLIAIFIPSKVMTIIYASAGAIIFTLYLAYDTQLLMGGKTYELSPEEYIFAAVQIYVDIMYIFMFLLMLIGNQE